MPNASGTQPNAALVRPEARHLVTGERFGTAGRPKVVAAYPEGDRGMAVVYEDGCIARRVWRDDGTLFAGGYTWVPVEGPDYDALFTETVRVETTPDD